MIDLTASNALVVQNTATPRTQTHILVGTERWSAGDLTANWYPRGAKKAAQRRAIYSEAFDFTVLDSAFKYPLSTRMAHELVQATSSTFKFVVPIWSLLSGHPTMIESIDQDIISEIKPEFREKPRIYRHYLSETAISELTVRQISTLTTLRNAGKLGCLNLYLPRWTRPGTHLESTIESIRQSFDGFDLSASLNRTHFGDHNEYERILEVFESLEIAVICGHRLNAGYNADSQPLLRGLDISTTTDYAFMSLSGTPTKQIASEDWWKYSYSESELNEIAQEISEIADACKHIYVSFANYPSLQAVNNARYFMSIIDGTDPFVKLNSANVTVSQ